MAKATEVHVYYYYALWSYGGDVVGPDGKAAFYAVTDSIIMFSSSKVKQAAWKFLDFLFTKQPRVEFTTGEGFLPTTQAEASDRYFTENTRLKVFVDLLPSAHFAPTVTGWEDTAKAISDAVQSVYLDKVEPAAALKQATDRANLALGK
jgi:multiple sugar transport system substrate-binding protein